MKPHLGKDTLVESPEQARARVVRMEYLERRLAEIREYEKDKPGRLVIMSLDQAIARYEQALERRERIREAG